MKYSRLILASLIGLVSILSQQNILGQEKAAPSHVHYKEPATQGVSPTGAIAPRLQKLGVIPFLYQRRTVRRSSS